MVSGMAFRNLGRHRVKTIITVTAVAVSVSLYIFMDAWIMGMNLDSRRNIVSYETGAAKIQTPSYFSKKDDLPMYESFSGWEEIAGSLEEAGYKSAPRFIFSGTLYSRQGSAPVLFNAIDVEREKKLLRYPDYIDAGRFPLPGKREIVLGIDAAEKLRTGIPQRLERNELETVYLSAAAGSGEREFIRSLYIPFNEASGKKSAFDPEGDKVFDDDRLVLKSDISSGEMMRFWNILSDSGYMDVRISTTIDMKALPEKIGKEKFNRDLLPLFEGAGRKQLFEIYTEDPLLGDYILSEGDEKAKEMVLKIMLDADYSGAVRHVNQLIDAVVVGVVNSPNPKTNANIAYIPIDSLQDEAGLMLEGKVTELLVRSVSSSDSALPGKDESPDAIKDALLESGSAGYFKKSGSKEAPLLDVYGWQEYAKDFFAAAAGDDISTKIMIFFLFVLSFLGIANTMLMAILERTRETGMMRALGMTDRQLLLAYMIEAAYIGMIGGFIGAAAGCLINIPMVNTGIDYSALTKAMGGDIGYRIASHFRSAWNIRTIVISFFAASLLSGCMAILPVIRVLKMPVTETLRFE